MEETLTQILNELKKVNGRLDGLETKVGTFEEGQKRIETRMDTFEEGQKRIETRMDTFEEGQKRIETRMDTFEDKVIIGFEQVNKNFDIFNKELNNKTQVLLTLSKDISRKLDRQSVKLDKFSAIINEHEYRIEDLEAKI
jgi:uncharacterized phage infection (PIP) family protein YhgE